MHGKLKFLHMANFFSTSLASEASDKYEVCDDDDDDDDVFNTTKRRILFEY